MLMWLLMFGQPENEKRWSARPFPVELPGIETGTEISLTAETLNFST